MGTMLKMLCGFTEFCLIFSKDLRNTIDEEAQGYINNCASNVYNLSLDSLSKLPCKLNLSSYL